MTIQQKYAGPTVHEVLSAKEEWKYTPDAHFLDKYKTQNLFIFDEMKKGLPGYQLIEGWTEQQCVAFTRDRFSMWNTKFNPETMRDDGATFPLTLDNFQDRAGARIKGEIHVIPADLLYTIDKMKHNGVYFTRQRRRFIVPYMGVPKHETPANGIPYHHIISAWMYLGNNLFWDKLVDWDSSYWKTGNIFKPVRRFEPRINLGEYYCWTIGEYPEL